MVWHPYFMKRVKACDLLFQFAKLIEMPSCKLIHPAKGQSLEVVLSNTIINLRLFKRLLIYSHLKLEENESSTGYSTKMSYSIVIVLLLF